MQTLNFYPIYQAAILTHTKNTTVRLGDQSAKYTIGECGITFSWEVPPSKHVKPHHFVSIISVDVVLLKSYLTWVDNSENTLEVLQLVYRTQISPDDMVTVITWRNV